MSASIATDAKATEEKLPFSFLRDEMRPTSMKLHTVEQAPKEGKAEAPKENPMANWKPSKANFIQFLVDSRAVYSALETHLTGELADLANSGLDRTEAIDKDLAMLSGGKPLPGAGAASLAYVKHINELADAGNTAGLLSHYYNHVFAHTAGGLQIGKMLCAKIDGLKMADLEFYKWQGSAKKPQELLDKQKERVDAIAGGWSREKRDSCLAEVGDSFKLSGGLMQVLFPEATAKA